MTDTILPDDGRPLPAHPVAEEPIPLPSDPDMIEALDNQRGAAAARDGADGPRRAAPAKAAEVAKLDFTRAMTKAVDLDFPFVLDGRTVDRITVRRLLTAEIGEIAAAAGERTIDLMDLYAVMTGLPAAVLRGLEAGDGDRVTEVALDFLPRAFRAASGS